MLILLNHKTDVYVLNIKELVYTFLSKKKRVYKRNHS